MELRQSLWSDKIGKVLKYHINICIFENHEKPYLVNNLKNRYRSCANLVTAIRVMQGFITTLLFFYSKPIPAQNNEKHYHRYKTLQINSI